MRSINSGLNLYKGLIPILSILFFSNTGFAQLDSVLVLDPVFISATRMEKNPDEIGRSISIISNEQIERSVYTNVSELLSTQEGIYIPGAGQNPGNTQSIFTRGSNSNQTVIMIDGLRITDPSAVNNALDLSELSLANVERIEIVRGSHSTLYGTGAIGAVINIITKKNLEPGFNGFAEIKAGALNDRISFSKQNLLQKNVFVNYTFKSGVYANVNLLNLNVNGIDATADLPVTPGSYSYQDKDDLNKMDLAGKVGFKNAKWDIFGSYKLTQQRLEIDAAAFLDDDNSILKFHRDQFNYGIRYKASDYITIQYSGGYSWMKRKTVNDSSIVNFNGSYDKEINRYSNSGAVWVDELQADYTMNGFRASVGIGHYDDFMTGESYYYSNLYGPPAYIDEKNLDTLDLASSIKHVFFYTDITGSLFNEKWDRVSLCLGTRYNHHSLIGEYFTYIVNPSFKTTENSLLFFSYSTGFNAPSLFQLYNPGVYSRGNVNLRPETSATYEVGFKQKINLVNFQINVFNTMVKDLIQYVSLKDKITATDNGSTPVNISQQENSGVELSMETTIDKKLVLGGNFSAVNGRTTYSVDDIRSGQISPNDDAYLNGEKVTDKEVTSLVLSRRPSYIANLNASYWVRKNLSLGVHTKLISSSTDAYYDPGLFTVVNVTLENYSLTDLQVNYLLNKNLSFNFRVENLFDKEYYEIAGYNTRGRSYFLKARYTFQKK